MRALRAAAAAAAAARCAGATPRRHTPRAAFVVPTLTGPLAVPGRGGKALPLVVFLYDPADPFSKCASAALHCGGPRLLPGDAIMHRAVISSC